MSVSDVKQSEECIGLTILFFSVIKFLASKSTPKRLHNITFYIETGYYKHH